MSQIYLTLQKMSKILAVLKVLCALHSLALFFLLFSGTSAIAAKPVTVGVFQFPPLVYTNDSGEHAGLFIDLIREVAKSEGWELTFVPGSWSDGFEKTRNGQLDLMPCVQQRPEREVFLDYPREAAFVVWGQVLVRNNSKIQDIFDLENKKIGLMKEDANGKNFLSLINSFHMPVTITYYAGFPEVARAIAKEEVDGGVFTNTNGHSFLDANNLKTTQIVFSPADLKFATAKGTNADLLATLDRYITEWKKDRHSPYYIMENKYFLTAPQESEYFWKYAIPSLLACIAMALVVMVWRSALRHQVKSKTDQLREELALRTQLAEQLRATAQRQETIIRTAMDGFKVVDSTQRILEVNDTACHMLGYTREELLSMRVSDIEADMSADEIATRSRQISETGEARFESHHRRRDGSIYDVEVSIKYQPIDGGRFVCFFRDITEKRRSERELSISEERLRLAAQAAGFGIYDFDLQEMRAYYSPEFFALYGLPEGATIELNEDLTPKALHPDDRQHFLTNMLAANDPSGSGLLDMEFRIYLPDGQLRWLRTRGQTSFTERKDSGRALSAHGILQDVTERKHVEEESKNLSHRLQLAARSAGLGIWDWNVVDNIMLWDDRMLELYGYKHETFPGGVEAWQTGLHPDDRARAWEECQAALRGDEEWDTEFRILCPDGTTKHLKADGVVLRNDQGMPLRMIGINYDITEQKRAEETLKESAYFLLESQRVGNIGSYKCDFVRDSWVSSEILDDIFGIESDFPRTIQGWLAIIHPEDRQVLAHYLREEVVGNRGHFNKEYRIVRKSDGQTRWVYGHGDVTIGKDGNALLMIGTIQDITDRKNVEEERIQLQERLAQSQKMEAIGTLAGGIAHDFNNILGAILGYTELSVGLLPPSDPVRENLQEVLVATGRAKELVRQILAFGRKGEKKVISVDTGLLVKEAMKLLTSVIPKTTSIETDIDPAAGHVLADPTELHQVVINLCTNAYQAMENESGLLRVRLSASRVDALEASSVPGLLPGDYVRLEVSDNGKGMDKETVAKIFEPYFTTKELGKGTGLGLALVHGIVTSLSGAIGVHSTPGIGTSFSIYLPKADPVITEYTEHRDVASLQGKGSVLVVDDEPALARLTAKMLESLGYKTRVVTDPLEAIRVFDSDPMGFDAIVTDQTMPGMTGAELVRRAKAMRPGIPTVMCTGYSDLIDEAGAKEIGVAAYLSKPYDRSGLGAAVAIALGKEG